MKKTLLTITAIMLFSYGSIAQNVNIPDAILKAYLVGNSAINTNSDNEIQVSEANAYSLPLNIQSLNISDLTGIEEFTSITKLICYNNTISGPLDLTQNIALTEVNCNQNNITSLNLSQITDLTILDFYGNNINNIDLTNNVNLEELTCHSNSLTSLNLTQNINLTKLFCSANNINALDLSNNPGLTQLGCNSNSLSVLNMRNLSTTLLTYFDASSNGFNLTCIDVDDVAAANSAWSVGANGVPFSLNCQVDLVNSIAVQGQAGASTISAQGGTLQMEANVLPTYADDDTYSWSVANGTGSASIDANGLLTAITNGDVTVTATANDASGTAGSLVVAISNQSSAGIDNNSDVAILSIYPNPLESQLTIDFEGTIESIEIVDLMGKTVGKLDPTSKNINVSELTSGIYFLQIESENNTHIEKFVKK